jgi:hypothetical protein
LELVKSDNRLVKTCISTLQLELASPTGRETAYLEVTHTPDKRSCSIGARFRKSVVKSNEVLVARSIEPFEGGGWRLRLMRANSWSPSNS